MTDRPRRDSIPLHPRFNESILLGEKIVANVRSAIALYSGAAVSLTLCTQRLSPSPKGTVDPASRVGYAAIQDLLECRASLVNGVCSLELQAGSIDRCVRPGHLNCILLNFDRLGERIELLALKLNHLRKRIHQFPQRINFGGFGLELSQGGLHLPLRGSEVAPLNVDPKTGGGCRRQGRRGYGEGNEVRHHGYQLGGW